MNIQSTRIALAVALALGGLGTPAFAQQAPATPAQGNPPAGGDQLETIQVTGIRASEAKSLEVKRDADSRIEVITAEDIGKMPDKNIADSLQRVIGVTTSSMGASEGGFDENDRVSMRGTSPSLTQTLINGHNIASGDWFVLNQTGTVGRSVSYTLLPSEIVSQVVVHKTSEASLVEGGVAGSVDIVTRKPLEFSKPVTVEVAGGAVYAQLPGKTDPQFNVLGNWKNDANNVGVMVQGFYEDRHLRRDGQELLGYNQFSGMTGANAQLNGVYYPGYIGSVLFEQERKRSGAVLDAQIKPTADLTLDANAFYSHLDAPNYNRNYILWLTHFVPGQAPNPGYQITGNTLTSASWTGVPTTAYGVYDQISRPDESSDSSFLSLEAKYRASANLKFSGQAGISRGDGKTPTQNVLETNPGVGSGGGYTLNGMYSAASWNLGNTNNTTPYPGGVPVAFGWVFGDQDVDVKDSENWLQLDGEYTLAEGSLTSLKFGLRYNSHGRTSTGVIGQGPISGASNPANWPQSFSNYPSNFGGGLGGNFPTGIWYFTPGQLAAYDSQYTNRTPGVREDWNSEFALHEYDSAAYLQGNLEGQGWSGNVGLRLVQTKEKAINNQAATAQTPGVITTSAFGPFVGVETDHSYLDVLPSANLKLNLNPEMIARFAASRTMTRPDYSALAGFVSLTPPGTIGGTGAGSGANPDLKPIVSTNLDAGIEWYFAKQSLLSATAFYMGLNNYVTYGSVTKNYLTFSSVFPTGVQVPYLITTPEEADGRVEGLELAYQQALNRNVGINANYTLTNAEQTSNVSNGDNRLVGASRNTYAVGGYYENDMFSARVNYTYRSAFFDGLDRSTAYTQDGIGNLNASFGYTYDQHFSASLDAMNLNNPVLKYYALNENQPRAFYVNGRQFYLMLRYKF